MRPSIKINNFDLIRLVAAAQVVGHHGMDHLHLDRSEGLIGLFALFTRYFPGVPVFFFVSGFLISKSYESSPDLWAYARNRVLRIYPALIACTLLSIAMVFALGYLPRPGASLPGVLTWLLAQISIVQFFNPGFMREFGVGVLNGSLWTITVELQFYVAVPVVYALCGLKRRSGNAMLMGLIALFLIPNVLYWHADPENNTSMLLKLFGVTFIPWFYMFLLGALAQRHFATLYGWLAGKALIVGAVYIVLAVIARQYLGWPGSNDIHPLLYVLLAAWIFSLAFTWPTLSERLLHRHDISYGIYIYHMPIINALLFLGMGKQPVALLLTYGAAILMAGLSWIYVERPFLALKRGGLGHAPVKASVSKP